MKYYTYILECKDGAYYTGVTNNIERRLNEHQEGVDEKCFTFKRRPVELVFFECFMSVKDAIALEKQIKKWSRKKKEALIDQNWNILKELAKCKNSSSHENYNIKGNE